MALVQLTTFNNRIEAELARMNLEVAGFTAMLFDAEIGGGWLLPIRLMVAEDESDEAAALLAEEGLL